MALLQPRTGPLRANSKVLKALLVRLSRPPSAPREGPPSGDASAPRGPALHFGRGRFGPQDFDALRAAGGNLPIGEVGGVGDAVVVARRQAGPQREPARPDRAVPTEQVKSATNAPLLLANAWNDGNKLIIYALAYK